MAVSDIFKKINSTTDAELVSGINELFDTSQIDYTRAMLERIWWRNLLYYLGEQYVEYVKSLQTFRRRIMPDYVPTPVSNEIREYVRSVKAFLLGQKMVVKVAPNTTEREDVKGAGLGELLLQNLDTFNDGEFLDEKEKTATSIPLFGVTFLRTFPQMFDDRWVFDKDGNLITQGDVGAEHLTPFQVYVDSLGDRLTKKRWVGIQSLKPKEWVEDTFKVKIGKGSDVKATDYNRRLMKLVGQVSPWKGAGLDSATYAIDDDSLVLFRETEMKPSVKYPQGRYIISCGDKLLKSYKRMPIKVVDGKWFYSITDFHFDYMPGSFWSDAGVNNLISPQNTINEIDQALAINRKGVARPTLFCPGEIGIKKLDPTGGLGSGMLLLSYDPLLSGGQRPEIGQGTPLPQQILAERDIQRQVFQDVSGDPKNILKGESPGSKASGIMVDILRETAEKGKYPDVERYTRSMTRVNKKRLLLAQEIFTEERILKVCGRGNKWSIIRFKSADLRNNTDIRMELDSGLASTNAGKMQVLLDFSQQGFFGNPTENPELREEVLSRSGLSGFTKQEDPDFKRAELENAKIGVGDFDGIFLVEPDPKTGEITPDSEVVMDDPYFKYDNHQVHYDLHREEIISEAFSELDPRSQTVLIHHTDIHHMQLVETQKNMPPEPHDPREFIQMDKLYPLLSRIEQMQILEELNIVPDPNAKIVGMVTAPDILEAQTKKKMSDNKEIKSD